MRLCAHLSATLSLPAMVTLVLASPAFAQSQFSKSPPSAGSQIQLVQQQTQGAPPAQAPAPPKPYKPVAVAPAAPANDPSFDAFRKQLADIAKKKDKSALGQIVVAQGFFWEGESGDQADKKKSSIENLAAAIALDDKQGIGWDSLNAAAQEPTLEAYGDKQGVMCAPASPKFDEKAFDELTKDTQTDVSEWGIPIKAGIEVRGAAQANAPVIDKLTANLIRVLPDESTSSAGGPPPAFLRVVLPSGKVGYAPVDAIAPMASDQICYQKDGNNWKIVGYVSSQ